MAHDPTDLRGQEERKQETEEASRIARLQYDSDLRWLMRQRPFRRFIWEVLARAGVTRQPWRSDQRLTDFLLGRMDIGLQLLEELESLTPDESVLMRRETREQKEMKAK
ncbi:MAG TPA: hypothetical protein VFD32_06605 [Dehalococcoidia bacterium]|nr:hypothetical protein [Dehalococcoidia bacterium]